MSNKANEFMAHALKEHEVPSGVSIDGSDPNKVTGYQYTALGALEAACITGAMQEVAMKAGGGVKEATEILNHHPIVAAFRSTEKSTGNKVTLLCISVPNEKVKGARRNVPIAVMFDDPELAMRCYEAPDKKTSLVCTFGEMVTPENVPTVSAEEIGNVFAGNFGGSKYTH